MSEKERERERRSVSWDEVWRSGRRGHDYILVKDDPLVMAAAEIPCGAFLLEVCAKTGDDIDTMLVIDNSMSYY